jgi:hypothetical protein
MLFSDVTKYPLMSESNIRQPGMEGLVVQHDVR